MWNKCWLQALPGCKRGAGRSRVQSPAAFLRSLPPSRPPADASAAFLAGYNAKYVHIYLKDFIPSIY